MSTGVAWMDGRSRRAAGTGKAASCDTGGGWGVAYEARGYKQGWADGRAGNTGKATAQININIIYKTLCNRFIIYTTILRLVDVCT